VHQPDGVIGVNPDPTTLARLVPQRHAGEADLGREGVSEECGLEAVADGVEPAEAERACQAHQPGWAVATAANIRKIDATAAREPTMISVRRPWRSDRWPDNRIMGIWMTKRAL
jgi:hypothetical protein